MKKLKLLMSVSLLCLSIAILCVGVFAITNVTYQIGGSISYEVEDVYCKITTKVYKAEAQRTAEQLQEDVNVLSATSLDKITHTLSQDMGTYDSYLKQGTASATGININFGKETSSGKYYYTYYIVINVSNLSTITNMYAVLNDSNTENNVYKVCKYSQDKILKDVATRNIVIAYSLIDIKQDTKLTFDYKLDVKKGNLVSNTITFDSNGGVLPSLLQRMEDDGSKDSLISMGGYTSDDGKTINRSGYYIKDGVVYIKSLGNGDDNYTMVNMQFDAIANRNYVIRFTGTYINGNQSFEIFCINSDMSQYDLLFSSGDFSNAKMTIPIRFSSKYYFRFDTNFPNEEVKIENFRVFESGTQDPGEKVVCNGATYGTLPIPTKAGHIFAGWFTQASGGTRITDTSVVSLSSNQTLYAHWN